MQLTKNETITKLSFVFKRFVFLLLVLALGRIDLFSIKGLLTIMFLPLAYISSLDYLILFFIGMLSSMNIYLVIYAISMYILLEILSHIHLIKLYVIPSIVATLLAIYAYIIYFHIDIAMLYNTLLLFLLEYVFMNITLELSTYFFHTTKLTKKDLAIFLSILLIICMNIYDYQPQTTLAIIYVIGIYSSYVISIKAGAYIGIISIFCFIFLGMGTLYDIIAMLMPIIVYSLYYSKTKIIFAFCYLMSELWIFFLPYDLWSTYFLKVLIACLIFILVPVYNFKTIENKLSASSLLENDKAKIKRKIELFSSLFEQITSAFKVEETPVNTNVYVGHFYNHVCKECSSNKQCYDRFNGNHKLVKLFVKGLDSKLNNGDIKYINNYCLNAKEYKEAIQNESSLYLQQIKLNQEYDLLKKNLYQQLDVVANILNSFSNNLSLPYSSVDEYILDLLESYDFHITYFKKNNLSKNEYELDIGITNVTTSKIQEDLIPILNQCYRSTFRIKNQLPKQKGYIQLKLVNSCEYYLNYGISQGSKDLDYCGDQYAIFEQGMNKVICMSDGMGHGKQAYEESLFVINLLQKFLNTGIVIKDSIQTMNTLLKIKNHVEMYTTLDLAIYNPYKNEMEFYKNGAMHSFIVRNGMVIEVKGRNMPIGIMSDIKTSYEKIELMVGDYIIMMSDGVDEYEEEAILNYIAEHKYESPQLICSYFNQDIIQCSTIDDATIIIMKIEQ